MASCVYGGKRAQGYGDIGPDIVFPLSVCNQRVHVVAELISGVMFAKVMDVERGNCARLGRRGIRTAWNPVCKHGNGETARLPPPESKFFKRFSTRIVTQGITIPPASEM